jgi:hypothetical protein
MSTRTRRLRIGACCAACGAIALGLLFVNSLPGPATLASGAPALLDVIPAGASSVVFIDLAAVRASSFYQHRPDKGPITIPNPDYAEFVRSTGFDFERDLDRVVIASWPTPNGQRPVENVAIAEGRFDRAKIRDYAAHQGKIDHQKGREVFLFPSGAQGGSNSAFFLDEHRLALVTGASIEPLFAKRADEPTVDPIRERASRFDGAAAFAITRVPPIPDNPGNGVPQGAATEQMLALARSVQWITLAARPEGDNLRISLEGECDNGSNAHQLQAALEFLRVFGRMGLDSPKMRESMSPAALASLQKVLAGAEVTQAAERVRVLVELSPDIFNAGASDNAK